MNHHSPLLTDLYQLTMAAGYWKSQKAEQESVFHLFFRELPFAGGYAIAAGLGDVVEWLEHFRFDQEAIDYLATLSTPNGQPLFETEFLQYLLHLQWRCNLDAIAEGTVVFPHQPILRVTGPLLQAQLVETALLNIINFQTLIATKASRICYAAGDDDVLEFGLRRAQGPDGGVMASRAAYIGGCAATSNVLAGKQLNIPVRGTHAHSWVMSFDDELSAFEHYAQAMPDNGIFLVDTFDTVQGIHNAIQVGIQLRARGFELAGIRLDSGDLGWLSIQARRLLDQHDFHHAKIVASNDLNEIRIQNLKQDGAPITVWGVGTQLVTGGAQAALGGVYKMGALKNAQNQWQPKVKLSEQSAKISTPGILQVRRYQSNNQAFVADAIYDLLHPCPSGSFDIIHPEDPTQNKTIEDGMTHTDLLEPVYRQGELQIDPPDLFSVRNHCRDQLHKLDPSSRRLENPKPYPSGLTEQLYHHKNKLAENARDNT